MPSVLTKRLASHPLDHETAVIPEERANTCSGTTCQHITHRCRSLLFAGPWGTRSVHLSSAFYGWLLCRIFAQAGSEAIKRPGRFGARPGKSALRQMLYLLAEEIRKSPDKKGGETRYLVQISPGREYDCRAHMGGSPPENSMNHSQLPVCHRPMRGCPIPALARVASRRVTYLGMRRAGN